MALESAVQVVSRFLVVPASVATTAAVSGKSVFPAAFVGSLAYMTVPIPRLICIEMIEALGPALWERAMVAIPGIVTVVHMAIEAGMAMEPGTRSDEDSARKPVGTVVSVGGAVIRRIVEISVRAHRSDAYVDSNLGRSLRRANHENKGKHWKCKELT